MNPDDYFNFFRKWGDVVSVTVASDNGRLLKKMTENRELDESIEAMAVTNMALEAAGKPVLKQGEEELRRRVYSAAVSYAFFCSSRRSRSQPDPAV